MVDSRICKKYATLTYLLIYLLTYLVTYLLIYLLTYLLAYLFTYLFSYLLTYLLTYLFTYLLIYLLTYLLTYLLIYLLTYLHTYLPTPWTKALLEKLTNLQVVKKLPAFYGTRSSLPHSQVPAAVPILSQINPVHAPHLPTS